MAGGTAKMSAMRAQIRFGMEVEECNMSGRMMSCLYTEQEKPEPVEKKVLVKNM